MLIYQRPYLDLLYEVIFKIRHERCPFNMVSEKYPAAVISSWCNEKVDVYDVRGETDDVIGVLKDIQRLVQTAGGRVKHRAHNRNTGRIISVSWGKNAHAIR